MVTYLFWAITFYLLIRFVFNFIIPVFRATRQMRSQVKEFQSHMQSQNNYQQPPNERPNKTEVKKGDYIDFEEVK